MSTFDLILSSVLEAGIGISLFIHQPWFLGVDSRIAVCHEFDGGEVLTQSVDSNEG